jgi:hypothetical protein
MKSSRAAFMPSAAGYDTKLHHSQQQKQQP